jgi:hypothetical protein
MHHQSNQDIKFAPSERPKRRRPIAEANLPAIAALALTASFIIVAFIYVSAYARLAQLEYRRQALTAEVRVLEAANVQLCFQIEHARARERVVAAAEQWGMALADPSSQVDYIVMPATRAGDARGAAPDAVLRNLALARKVTSIVTTGWGGAAQGAAGGRQVARP